MEKKVPEQSISKSPDVKISKDGSKASFSTRSAGAVEDSRENGVRVSSNGKEDLSDDNSGDDVVAVVQTKVVETEIEVKNGDDSRSLQGSGSFSDAGDEMAGDDIGSVDDGVSLLADVSTEMGKIGVKKGRESSERKSGGSSNENGENSDEMDLSNDGEGEEENFNGENEFCEGDFVWGKIKSHPWWPGQIYDSSNASDYALKVRHRDRLLVAYFDGTFAWCHPYQLKPFAENFEEMSRQSTSKNFINAVQEAVGEIGRLVELKMTCSCVPNDSLVGLASPLTVNSGIKQGVHVPEGGIAKLWTYMFGPTECLTELKHIARVVSMSNLLALTELKCWLSAFYRAKGGYKLASFHEPQPIPGLEDNDQDPVLDRSHGNNTAEVPLQGPVEEETDQSLLQIRLGDSENGLFQRRKQKSIAEIMEGNADAQVENVEQDVAKERTGPGHPAMPSGRRKKKSNDEVNGGSNLSSKPKRRKVTKLLESTRVTESGMPSVKMDSGGAREETKWEKRKSKGSRIENNGSGSREENNVNPMPSKRKTNKKDNADAEEQIEKGFLSRERKKSKYLSPPYTSISKRQSIKDIQAESLKLLRETPLAEQMSKAAAVSHIGSQSSPILSCSDEVAKNKDSADVVAGHEASDMSSRETHKWDQSTVIDARKVKVSTNKVLSGTRSLAIDQYSLKNKSSLDVVGGFLSTFRSSVFCNGSNYKMYNKSGPGKKRKNLDSEHSSSSKFQTQTDQKSSEHKNRQTKIKRNEEEKSSTTKSKQTAMSSEMKTKGEKTEGIAKPIKNTPKQAAMSPKTKTAEEKTDGKEKSNKPKPQQAARAQDKKRTDKETDGEATQDTNANSKETDGKVSSATLFVTFGPGSSLPTKNDLIRIYSKFGPLNEEETDMFYTNYSARVVFLRSSDAEDALKSSRLASPFTGGCKVKFRLQSLSPSKMRKLKEISNAKPQEGSKMLEKGSALKSLVDEASPFNYMRQKLESIASVLDNSAGKISKELKSRLEGEVNELLEKVNNVVGSSSS